MNYQELLILEAKGKEEEGDIITASYIIYGHLMKFISLSFSSDSWCKSVILNSVNLNKISKTGWTTFDHHYYENMKTIRKYAIKKVYLKDGNNEKLADKSYDQAVKEFDHPFKLTNTLVLVDWMYAHVGHGTYDDRARKYLEVAREIIIKGGSIDDL